MKKVHSIYFLLCLSIFLYVQGCANRNLPATKTETPVASESEKPSKQRIIMHDPVSLKEQIHQVDTAMRFIPLKLDTLKKE